MANKKFSEFVLKTSTSDVSHIVGYNGAENVQITPANFVTSGGTGVFLPLAGGTMTGDTTHNDNVKSIYGSPGNDLQIYHDGSNSVISDEGTGLLAVRGSEVKIKSPTTSEVFARFIENESVELFYDGSKKFETSNTGISVTGDVTTNTATELMVSLNTTAANGGYIRLQESGATKFFLGSRASISGGSGTGYDLYAIGDLRFFTGAVQALDIDASQNSTFGGDVSLGNVKKLKFGLSSDASLQWNNTNNEFEINTSADASEISITAGTTNTYTSEIQIGARSSAQGEGIFFKTRSAEKMRLDSSGNLGLGTSTPSSYFADNLVVKCPSEGGITIASNTTSDLAYLMFADGTTGNEQYRGQLAYNHSTDAMSFATSGSGRLIIDGSGNVGIGISGTSPNAKLEVVGISGAVAGTGIAYLNNLDDAFSLVINNAGTSSQNDRGVFDARVGGTSVFKINNSGNIVAPAGYIEYGATGSGYLRLKSLNPSTTAMGVRLVSVLGATIGRIYSEGDATTSLVSLQSGDGLTSVNVNQNTHIDFRIANSEKMRISSAGNFHIGKTVASPTVNGWDINSTGTATAVCNFSGSNEMIVLNQRNGAGTTQFEFRNGDVERGRIEWTTSGTTYNTNSDYRAKENLKDFNGLDKVSQIKVYDFNWIETKKQDYGVVAHELQEVLPLAVSGEKDAKKLQAVDYSKIVPLLVKSIQELSAKLESLECQCKKK